MKKVKEEYKNVKEEEINDNEEEVEESENLMHNEKKVDLNIDIKKEPEKGKINKKDWKYYIKCIYKIIINIYILIHFKESYSLYWKSLEKCFKGVDLCPREIKWIEQRISEEKQSIKIMAILIELITLNIISRFHLIHIIIIFSYFYYYSHGLEFHDHGYFNFIGFIVLISFTIIVCLPFNIVIFLAIKIKKITYKIIILLFIPLFLYLVFHLKDLYDKTISDCSDWPKGLNNTYIDNDKLKIILRLIMIN